MLTAVFSKLHILEMKNNLSKSFENLWKLKETSITYVLKFVDYDIKRIMELTQVSIFYTNFYFIHLQLIILSLLTLTLIYPQSWYLHLFSSQNTLTTIYIRTNWSEKCTNPWYKYTDTYTKCIERKRRPPAFIKS